MFQWLHIRPGEAITVVLGDKAPLWYSAHWTDGRMRPCKGDGCRDCAAGIGKQRRWVFACRLWAGKKPFLWETSESLAREIQVIASGYGQTEDLKLYVVREGSGRKGRLSLTGRGLDEQPLAEKMVYPEPQEALELTWSSLEREPESFPRRESSFDEYRRKETQEKCEY
jgi:hypothetical protein